MMPLGTHQAHSPTEELHTSQGRNTFVQRARKEEVWKLGTWNVRSIVDREGTIEVASQDEEWGEDRKVNLVVRELARHGVVAGALQETKWFGYGTYEVGDSIWF